MKRFSLILALVVVSACADTTVTPMSRNQFLISTSAAPACGQSGAQKIVLQMAAVETIRQGFDGFIVSGSSSANNVRAISTGPTGSTTTGQFHSTGAFNSTTTYTGSNVIYTGSNDAQLAITTFKQNEPGFRNAVNARNVLGDDWAELVENGIQTCV